MNKCSICESPDHVWKKMFVPVTLKDNLPDWKRAICSNCLNFMSSLDHIQLIKWASETKHTWKWLEVKKESEPEAKIFRKDEWPEDQSFWTPDRLLILEKLNLSFEERDTQLK